jgi:predicted transcriptional regulator
LPEMDWESYGLVISSQHRKAIVQSLSQGPKSPKEIWLDTRLRPSRVSRILRELDDHDLVLCLTPRLRKGKIYQLTALGQQIASMVK